MTPLPLDIRLKPSFLIQTAFLSVVTLGIFPVVSALFLFPYYPRRLSSDGITLRNGTFVRWSAHTRTESRAVSAAGVRVTTTYTLWFGRQKVIIAPMAITPTAPVLAALRQLTQVETTVAG